MLCVSFMSAVVVVEVAKWERNGRPRTLALCTKVAEPMPPKTTTHHNHDDDADLVRRMMTGVRWLPSIVTECVIFNPYHLLRCPDTEEDDDGMRGGGDHICPQ
jgi:hypothetical protein